MTAIEFWQQEVQFEQQHLQRKEPYSSMNTGTVAMFQIAMGFAERYANSRITEIAQSADDSARTRL